MMGEDRWRDRCERYFSSITDIRKEAKANAVADAKKQKKQKKKDKHEKRKKNKAAAYLERQQQTNNNINNVFSTTNNNAAAAAARTTKKTTKKTTMKKTTEDHVVIRANGKAYRTKVKPLKGPRLWLSSLDLHGTSMFLRTGSVLHFFVWVLVCLAACGAFGYLVYLVVDDFLDETSHFKVTVGTGLNLSLAVSVCNLNPLRKTHVGSTRFAGLLRLNSTSASTNFQQVLSKDLDLLVKKTQLQRFMANDAYAHLNLQEVLEELQKGYPVYGAMMTEEDWDNLYVASLKSGHYDSLARALRMTPLDMSSLGHHMQAALLQCVKNGRKCESSDVQYPRVMDYGNCAQIGLSLDSSTWTDTLSLIFDVEPEEYVDFATSTQGMRVFLHSVRSGLWETEEYIAPVGSALKLHVVKTKEVVRLPSKCSQEPDYDHSYCMQRCMEEETRAVCGCSRSITSSLNQKCRPFIQYEFLCYRMIEILARRDQLQCNCPSDCRLESFDVQMSQVPWPSSKYEVHLRKSFLANGIIKPFLSLQGSLAKIEISLGHTDGILMTEEKDATLLQLMFQIGALSALTVGVSMVTGLEIVWLIGRMFTQCIKAAWRGRRDDNQVKAMSLESCPEFDDLGFNWYSLQGPDGDLNGVGGGAGGRGGAGTGGSGPAVTTETDLTPPLAPNLLGLDPIVEESDVDIRAIDGVPGIGDGGGGRMHGNEDNLYTHAWERSGQSRPYTRVLVSGKDANISDAPLLNSPGNHTSLRSEMYRPGGVGGASPSQPNSASSPYNGRRVGGGPMMGGTAGMSAGNYILKSRAPYTWHSNHSNAGPSSPRPAVLTPADFIAMYGQTARQLYEDDNEDHSFYIP